MTNEALVMDYQNGNGEALNTLIKNNIGLVHHFANKYSWFCQQSFVDEDDLIQEGMIGLMRAAEKFDPEVEDDEPERKFSTYASKAIMGRIFRTVNQHIPREKKANLESELIRINSIHDFIPGSENTTWEEVIPFEKKVFQDVIRDFDNVILNDDLMKLLDEVFGEEFTADSSHESEIKNMEAYLERKKQGITSKELLLLHFGLLGKRMSFSDIAECVNLSVQRLSFLEAKAIHQIRTSEHIHGFIEKYGWEFDTTIERWKESMNQKTITEVMTVQIEALDDLLKAFIS